ncbi:MAG: AraC family transcriptional regulator [Prevotellaceae bacterium]|jgi:AraC-like DNA-binding protein|nr:AraC family transcriptional regulator [Prevotellaceae bacterium]
MSDEYNNLETRFKYLIPNDRDRKFGLWVNAVGFERIPPNSSYPLKVHPLGYLFNAKRGRTLHEYQLLYITKGKGLFASEDMPERQVGKGSLFVLFPGQWHTFRSLKETGWNAYYIGFEGAVADNLIKEGFLSKEAPLFDVGLNEELVSLFSRALEVAEDDKMSSQQHLAGIVLLLIGTMLAITKNKSSSMNPKIEQAKIIMSENVLKNIDPETLAKKLNVSYSWFRKAFKDYTGFAPTKYFKILKLQKAKHLLVESSYSVTEISFMLGYESTKHFYALFKKFFNLTPLKYRNSTTMQKKSEAA